MRARCRATAHWAATEARFRIGHHFGINPVDHGTYGSQACQVILSIVEIFQTLIVLHHFGRIDEGAGYLVHQVGQVAPPGVDVATGKAVTAREIAANFLQDIDMHSGVDIIARGIQRIQVGSGFAHLDLQVFCPLWAVVREAVVISPAHGFGIAAKGTRQKRLLLPEGDGLPVDQRIDLDGAPGGRGFKHRCRLDLDIRG